MYYFFLFICALLGQSDGNRVIISIHELRKIVLHYSMDEYGVLSMEHSRPTVPK